MLSDVSLAIEAGSYTVLLGPSGSGKTTLLSILGGFLDPSEGEVIIGGRDCTASCRRRSVRQPRSSRTMRLFPHMSVGGQCRLRPAHARRGAGGRETGGRGRRSPSSASRALPQKRPHQLSGGQRQRVALARALVVEPAVLLLDEPLGALDLKLRRQMQDELKAIQARVGTAFVHVTHDQEEAMALADHCVVMNHGRIEDEGPPERVYARPATRFSATFMGESTLLAGPDRRPPIGNLPDPGEAGALAIRPEKLALAEAAGPCWRLGPRADRIGRLPGQLQARSGPLHRASGSRLRRPGGCRELRSPPGDTAAPPAAPTTSSCCRDEPWPLPPVDHADWYETLRMGDGVTLIHEPWIKPFFRCNIWHVRGRDRDLLFDTGLGHVSLRRHVALVTERPLICVASHTHFDHIGCHHEFRRALRAPGGGGDPRRPAQRMDACRPLRDRRHVRSPAGTAGRPSATPSSPHRPQRLLDDGDVIDLGDRRFEVVHTPGHSPGGIGLFERTSGIFLSGDIIYDGPLIDDAYHSDRAAYVETMLRLRDLPVAIVHGGHFPSFGPTRFRQLVEQYLAGRRKAGCHLAG